MQQKGKKRKGEEGKAKIKKNLTSKSLNFDFCGCPSQNVVKYDASGKKRKLLCCKCLFDQNKANLAETQPESHQSVQKRIFGKKARGSMG